MLFKIWIATRLSCSPRKKITTFTTTLVTAGFNSHPKLCPCRITAMVHPDDYAALVFKAVTSKLLKTNTIVMADTHLQSCLVSMTATWSQYACSQQPWHENQNNVHRWHTSLVRYPHWELSLSSGLAWFMQLSCKDLIKPLLKVFGDQSLDEISKACLLDLKEKILHYSFCMIHIPGTWQKATDTISCHRTGPDDMMILPDDVCAQVLGLTQPFPDPPDSPLWPAFTVQTPHQAPT